MLGFHQFGIIQHKLLFFLFYRILSCVIGYGYGCSPRKIAITNLVIMYTQTSQTSSWYIYIFPEIIKKKIKGVTYFYHKIIEGWFEAVKQESDPELIRILELTKKKELKNIL